MKKYIATLIILALGAVSAFAHPAGSSSSRCPVDVPMKKRNENSHEVRPKAPSIQSILCVYWEGMLLMNFNVLEGMCSLEVESSQGVQNFEFSSESDAKIYIGFVDWVKLTIETENGNTYYGELN